MHSQQLRLAALSCCADLRSFFAVAAWVSLAAGMAFFVIGLLLPIAIRGGALPFPFEPLIFLSVVRRALCLTGTRQG
jgi:hypothetical protein